jgi:hypothetical protein
VSQVIAKAVPFHEVRALHLRGRERHDRDEVLATEVVGERMGGIEAGRHTFERLPDEHAPRPRGRPTVGIGHDALAEREERIPFRSPHAEAAEGTVHLARPRRRHVRVEARGVDDLGGRPAHRLVSELRGEVGLVGGLVLGEPGVAEDAEGRAAVLAVVGHVVRRERGEVGTHRPHEFGQRRLAVRLPAGAVGLEPAAIVVRAEVLEETEGVGGEHAPR